jgi:protein-disulfide isomerase
VSLIAILAFAGAAAAQSESDTLAVVNGEPVMGAEVFAWAASQLEELASGAPRSATFERDRLAVLWTALDSIVAGRLIRLEAASRGMTVEELLAIEVDSHVIPPTQSEVEAFYQEYRDSIPLPREEALVWARQYMTDYLKTYFLDPLVVGLKRKYAVETYLDPLRTEVVTAGHPSRGPADAAVTIVEFGDFECPFCLGFFPTLKEILRNYPGEVRAVWRHFPNRDTHPNAQKAAEASMCADDQGRFWDYHDSLFANQLALRVLDLKLRAIQMGLDTNAFNACLDSGEKADFVQRDVDDGIAIGVVTTPTLFINGRRLNGNQPYREVEAVIEDELRRMAAGR